MTRLRLVLPCLALLACPPKPPPTSVVLQGEGFSVKVESRPFSMTITGSDGRVRLKSTGGPRFTRDDGQVEAQLVPGWDGFKSREREWTEFTDATLVTASFAGAALRFTKDGKNVDFTVSVEGTKVRTSQSIDDTRVFNKSALAFELADDDHFFGMGQRTASVDHRGLMLYSWPEEGGLGGGENTPLSATNPYPNGPSMTYFPVPLFHGTKGASVLVDTTRRSEVHFGSSAPELKIAVEGASLDLVVFVRDSPLDVLDDYTELTGRPPIPAAWAWGPRRRINRGAIVDGLPEWAQMRARNLPLTTVDDAMHSLPSFSQKGIEPQLQAWTTELHANGFKVMDYNNPYVSASAPNSAPDYQFGAANNFFEMSPDGGPATSFFLSGGPQTISTIDLTNPAAVTWFQGLLGRSFDLGYDGWMHDFGEYVGRTSRFADGRTGLEVHNDFPVLSTKAMIGAIAGHDAHVFSRSGYTGSQAWVLEDWGGDPEATFDETEGLPAVLRGGLNLGMVAVPYWSTDIGGYKCLTDAPNDKEMLVRWYEMSALSPMMHDEDACSNPVGGGKTKAKIWDDQQSQDIWREMAGLHTRLAPYLRALALDAHAKGRPMTIHPVLLHPQNPDAWKVEFEFFLGPALYSAPVVRRGQTMRHVWLPPGQRFVEWTERTVHVGGAYVDVSAPLERLPLFLVENTLVPLLDAEVQTLAPATVPGVVTEASRAGVLDVIAVVGPAGVASFTLADGSTFKVTRLASDEGNPGAIATAANEAELKTCAKCSLIDTRGTKRVRISATGNAQLNDVKVETTSTRTIRWEVLTLD
ncbi:MAG: glycoside hydrolase family 31 protein [Archangium sp.]